MIDLAKYVHNYFAELQQLGSSLAQVLFRFQKQRAGAQRLKLFESIVVGSRHLIINDARYRFLNISKLPSLLDPQQFFRLINYNTNQIFCMHLQKLERADVIKKIKLRRSVLESESNWKLTKGKRSDVYVDVELQKLNLMLDKIVNNNEDLFKVSIYLASPGSTSKDLILKDREFKEFAAGLDFEINTCSFQQLKAFYTMLPLGKDHIMEQHNLLTSNLLSLLPFHYREHIDRTGVFMGFNKIGGGIFIKDLLNGSNMNMVIFGSSGAGKSVTAKLLIMRFRLRKVRQIIIDPEGEYLKLCKKIQANIFSISEHEGLDPVILINSLSCTINQRVELLCDFFYSLQKIPLTKRLELSKIIKSYLQQNKDLYFKGLVKELLELKQFSFLQEFISGSVAPLFKGSREIKLEDQIICFDLSGIYSQNLKISIIMLIAECINILLKNNKEQTLIFIDEAHKLLNNHQVREFYINLVKTARKRKAGVVSITQNPEDLTEENGSRIVISQAEHIFLLKLSSASLNYIKRFQLFDLTESDYSNLSQLQRGSALLLSGKDRFYLDIFPFEQEKEILFT
jgi:type IV secretory pathway VirB4 component